MLKIAIILIAMLGFYFSNMRDFVGQERVKEQLSIALAAAKAGPRWRTCSWN